MKKTVLISILIFISFHLSGQNNTKYQNLQKNLTRGWNTWTTWNMLSHVHLPSGFTLNATFIQKAKNQKAILKRTNMHEDTTGWQKPAIHPDIHTYDGDYTSLKMKWKHLHLKIETATRKNNMVMLITPLKKSFKYAGVFVVESGFLWNKQGTLRRKKNTIKAKTASGKQFKVYTPNKVVQNNYYYGLTPYLPIPFDSKGAIGISADKKLSISEIKSFIEKEKQEYLEKRDKFGDLKKVYTGMQSALAWNTIYDKSNNRVITQVDRQWNINRGGYSFFGWDNFFISAMCSLDNKKLAYANAIEHLNEATEKGFISNQSQGNGRKSWDRSQPPVGGLICKMIYQKYEEKWFLEKVFPKLLKWNRWWIKDRKNGKLLSWGSHESKNPYHDKAYHNLLAAKLESGMDDSPMYSNVTFNKEKNIMELWDVGLNSLYIADCKALAYMAEKLGKDKIMKELRKRAKKYEENLQILWNEDEGIFMNYYTGKEKFSKKLSPTLFYPLIAEAATKKQAKTMIEKHFYNEKEFWGEWILPSISKDDPAFEKQKYWKGAIWAPLNFLVYMGLRNYDLPKAQKDLAEKSRKIFEKEWTQKGYVSENYSSITGTGDDPRLKSSRFYTWGGLMGFISLIENGYYYNQK